MKQVVEIGFGASGLQQTRYAKENLQEKGKPFSQLLMCDIIS
jgi:hypothetical protein